MLSLCPTDTVLLTLQPVCLVLELCSAEERQRQMRRPATLALCCSVAEGAELLRPSY